MSMTKTKTVSKISDWIEIGHVEDIPRLGSRIVKRTAGNIALFRTEDDKVFAIADKCPHKGGPLSQGIVHDCFVTCPLHNWVLNLETGTAVAPDEGKVPTFPIRLDNGVIFLKVYGATGESGSEDRAEKSA